jgi:hypothetical protein
MIADIIIKHTQRMFDETSINAAQFSERLFGALEQEGLVVYTLSREDSQVYAKWLKSQMNRFTRIMKKETPLNANFIFTWLALMPVAYQESTRQEILRVCFGVLDIKLPSAEPKKGVNLTLSMGHLSRSFSEVMLLAAPLLDDSASSQDTKAFTSACENTAAKLLEASKKL